MLKSKSWLIKPGLRAGIWSLVPDLTQNEDVIHLWFRFFSKYSLNKESIISLYLNFKNLFGLFLFCFIYVYAEEWIRITKYVKWILEFNEGDNEFFFIINI